MSQPQCSPRERKDESPDACTLIAEVQEWLGQAGWEYWPAHSAEVLKLQLACSLLPNFRFYSWYK
jgi:hypothetical protein